MTLMLATDIDPGADPTGLMMSEKFDGLRCASNGAQLVKRSGAVFAAPDWFIDALPRLPFDGELWCGRGLFEQTSSAVQKKTPVDVEWRKVVFKVFDLTTNTRPENFIGRMQTVRSALYCCDRSIVQCVEHVECKSPWHFENYKQQILDAGGEGVCLREPLAHYQPGEGTALRRWKPEYTTEATVTGYTKGTGRNAERAGSLIVREDTTGVAFKVGGLSDALRDSPPRVGTVVEVAFTGRTRNNVPRFPRFMRLRSVVQP